MVLIYVRILSSIKLYFKTKFNLVYRYHCHLLTSEDILHLLTQVLKCSPAVLWFTSIAILHIIWISSLCITILFQVKLNDFIFFNF